MSHPDKRTRTALSSILLCALSSVDTRVYRTTTCIKYHILSCPRSQYVCSSCVRKASTPKLGPTNTDNVDGNVKLSKSTTGDNFQRFDKRPVDLYIDWSITARVKVKRSIMNLHRIIENRLYAGFWVKHNKNLKKEFVFQKGSSGSLLSIVIENDKS